MIYLLDGAIEIVRDGSVIRRLNSEDNAGEFAGQTASPIFGDLTEAEELPDHARCGSTVSLLSIQKQRVESLLQQSYGVEETPLQPVEAELLSRIYPMLQSGQIKLPGMPDVAIRVRLLIQDEQADINDITKIVQTDPAIAAHLIQAANSAAFRGVKTVVSIREAATRLGLKRSANLALGMALHDAFSSADSVIAAQMRRNWELSVHVSAYAFIIARHTRLMAPEHALLGGLLHRIGAIPILQYLQDLSPGEAEIEQALRRFTPLFGGILLKDWGFDQEFITAAEETTQWQRDPDPEPDLCDIINTARLYVNLRAPEPEALPDLVEVPGFKKLGLGAPDSERTLQVLEEASDEIASIREFLN
ncbi:hypothetical protein BW247_07940 [Acidihalobacter ferrooxydans]|uniref:HDOD domain-containing protein n=1 Tax=Acidihalobacter ferrooxydans TaxID=1765967 RepID=A0A1P8UGS2_9GAMM|nr:hypothetical protein BW247_07940 [Acidihalobacter ferrooxydans]